MFGDSDNLPTLIGEARSLLHAMEQVSRLAPLDRPVLLIGERGTGKELVAARLHFLSRRWDGPFIKVNCAALSDELLDSELFGYEPGAFTGANKRHIGRFERADGGTLFMDEIATAGGRLQEKLLRVIEYGEFERLGDTRTRRVDVRVLAATNVDLPRHAAEGRFRADLLDRLAFDVVTLPPLRARPEDIPLLTEHFAVAMVRELAGDRFPGFAPDAMTALMAHDWPGNVRELRNVVERSICRAPRLDRPIGEAVIDAFASPWRPVDAAKSLQRPQTPASPNLAPPKQTVPDEAAFASGSLTDRVQAFERRLIEQALDGHRHNQRATAKALGLGYHQLRHALRRHDLLPAKSRSA